MANAAVHSVYYDAAVDNAVVAGRLHNAPCRQAPPYLAQEHVMNRDHERGCPAELKGREHIASLPPPARRLSLQFSSGCTAWQNFRCVRYHRQLNVIASFYCGAIARGNPWIA